MQPTASAETAWTDLRGALRRGEPRARLRLLATVAALVAHAARGLAPETRAEVCERIAAALEARIRAQTIGSAAQLLHALDGELAGWLPGEARDGLAPTSALLARLGDSLSALPEAQQRALAAYYGPGVLPEPADTGARSEALVALRGCLSLDAR